MAAKYGVLLIGIIASFLHYTGYQNFIKDPIIYFFNKSKSKGFLASSVSTYDFSTLYSTLPR